MVQMNWFAEQKSRHRSREQTYGHQEPKERGAQAEAWPGLRTSKVQTCSKQHVKGGQVTIMTLDIVNHSRLKLLAITRVWLL